MSGSNTGDQEVRRASSQPVIYSERTRSANRIPLRRPRRFRESYERLTAKKQPAGEVLREQLEKPNDLNDEAKIPELGSESQSAGMVGESTKSPEVSFHHIKFVDISGMPPRPRSTLPLGTLVSEEVMKSDSEQPDPSRPSFFESPVNAPGCSLEGINYLLEGSMYNVVPAMETEREEMSMDGEDDEPVEKRRRGPGARWTRTHVFKDEIEAEEWLGALQEQQTYAVLRTNVTQAGSKRYMYCSSCGHPTPKRRSGGSDGPAQAPVMIMLHFLAHSSAVHAYSNGEAHYHTERQPPGIQPALKELVDQQLDQGVYSIPVIMKALRDVTGTRNDADLPGYRQVEGYVRNRKIALRGGSVVPTNGDLKTLACRYSEIPLDSEDAGDILPQLFAERTAKKEKCSRGSLNYDDVQNEHRFHPRAVGKNRALYRHCPVHDPPFEVWCESGDIVKKLLESDRARCRNNARTLKCSTQHEQSSSAEIDLDK
ncbi:hypothetical protein Pmar_PMAR019015 [Perkinsus marinus ATCC 50983]|uniref:Uncharacterized protein n=1 Tax=Perkinsus marinus (strain ATCC 50983 / TXsc) TaxID=423536 RepID=C5KY30_PERM5|nr:hypothetical protein Pmar_PMAR019015 [Perkinsus marinus ATCC 50983]EER10637.1 hypothetical protein Pmar_PMAR019015 [Perkinsus marinus ATCC 50983]|eukprot:XP_002778842.1 hypothetical protein Pmar_PMAR019015 [Perkinsus marinus ATCC 50983]